MRVFGLQWLFEHVAKRRDAVEVVEILGVMTAEGERQAEQRLEDHRGLGDPERVPEAGRRAPLEPVASAPHPRDEVGGAQPDEVGVLLEVLVVPHCVRA